MKHVTPRRIVMALLLAAAVPALSGCVAYVGHRDGWRDPYYHHYYWR